MAHEDHPLLARARARLRVTLELRAEAADLAARLLEADRRLAEIEGALRSRRDELREAPTEERRAELLREVEALETEAGAIAAQLGGEDQDARIEALEIEVGLATDDALRIREAVRQLADNPTEQDPNP